MSECIHDPKIKPIFGRMNIFVHKYSNSFEYPNIRYTLLDITAVAFSKDFRSLPKISFFSSGNSAINCTELSKTL